MLGGNQYEPLLLTGILEFAAANFPDRSVTGVVDGRPVRSCYREVEARARRLASGLRQLGVGEGTTVSSLAWTTREHFELFYAVPGLGALLHTANPRLSPDQIAFTITEAGATILFVDPLCVPLLRALEGQLPRIERVVVLGSDIAAPDLPAGLFFSEAIMTAADPTFAWPRFDERTASTLCFTSGSTGDPKGVAYTHRGSYLSALSLALPTAWGVSGDDTILAVGPLFHCNAWGAGYIAPMVGASLVLPGRALDGPSLHRTLVEQGVTIATGVPTVWLSLLEHCEATGSDLGKLTIAICGGAAPSETMIDRLEEGFGVKTYQVWGMTETTSAATLARAPDRAQRRRAPQGRPIFGTRIRIVDGNGRPLPHDGLAQGELQLKASWCASHYLNREPGTLGDAEGWLSSGDLAAITPDGQLRITDRLKDVIKSGGEWVSSLDLELAAAAHPGVAEAAVIGVPHPRWSERPIMLVVPRSAGSATSDEITSFLAGRVPKLWIPDAVVFVRDLPRTTTGKIDKVALRASYGAILQDGLFAFLARGGRP